VASSAVVAVIDQLAEELARSVVVNDPAMQMLYASAHYGDEDPVRVRALLNHGAEPKARGHVLAQGVSGWTRAGVIPPNPEIGMHARVCVPVRWRGELLGLLMVVDAHGTLTISELNRVNEIAADLAVALQDERAHVLPAGDDTNLVLDLTGADPSLRRDAVAALHATGRARLFAPLTAVEVAVSGGAAPHVQVAVRAALAGRPRASELVAVDDRRAVLLIGGAEPVTQRVDTVLERVGELAAGRFRCVAGIGSAGDGLGHAARSLRQARSARYAAELGLRGPVAAWDALGAYGPLLSVPPGELTGSALPHELQRVRALDADGQLAATVRAYLDAAGNGPLAAAALHIHRTSLYYRLGRVRDLTGLDLADGATRLALHLGFAMLDVIEARLRQSERDEG
jgi:hypothetical protein